MPKDFLKSKFVVIPKKQKGTKCRDYRTISLMSHGMKLLLKIILNKMIKTIDREVGELQFGFREKTGTQEAIFVLKILMERSIQVQKDVHLCFIDYKKALIRCNINRSLKH